MSAKDIYEEFVAGEDEFVKLVKSMKWMKNQTEWGFYYKILT